MRRERHADGFEKGSRFSHLPPIAILSRRANPGIRAIGGGDMARHQRAWLTVLGLAIASQHLCFALGSDLPSATNPATTQQGQTEGLLRIVVTSVQGQAEVKPSETDRWQRVVKGQELVEGCQFRTGPHGTIQFAVGVDDIFRVDRLSLVRVIRANLANGKIKTTVGMSYGRVSKDVDAPILPHDDTIVSPSSTLAVRGTQVSLYDQPPYVPEAVSLTGHAVFDTMGRERVSFGAKGEGTAIVTANNPDPAGNALASSIVDPSIAAARTAAEQKLLADLITQGAVVSFSVPEMLPIVYGVKPPPTTQLETLTPGDLVFYIRWNTNTNVDLEVLQPTTTDQKPGIGVLPLLGLNENPITGAQILFNDIGGPTGGFEVVSYPSESFPDGLYTVYAVDQGPLPAKVRVNAFVRDELTDKLTPQEFNFDNSPFRGTVQPTLNIAPGSNIDDTATANVDKSDPNSAYNGSLLAVHSEGARRER